MNKFRSLCLITRLMLATILLLSSMAWADSLYITDESDNSVNKFDATTWAYQGEFVKSTGGLKGPMGMVFNSAGELIVVAQHVNTSATGSILKYSPTGKFLGAIVPQDSPGAPNVPRGMILGGNLFVADFIANSSKNGPFIPGFLREYSASGALIGSYAPHTGALPTGAEFHPRGVVLGPDGLLYVSNVPSLPPPGPGTGLGGQVLRFNPANGAFVDVFVTSSGGPSCGCANELNRPEGLVFSPDHTKLYITSFRANSSDNDKILIFDAVTGAYLDHIDLDVVSGARAFAQALLFGPGGKLYVPISGNGPDTGAVRAYDVTTKTYTNVVPPAQQGGPLGSPFYLTFGGTNPATLAYGN